MIIHEIEQYTPEYWDIRAGKPTASNASKMVTSTGGASKQVADYAAQLAADKFAGKAVDEWAGNKYTQNGTEKEPLARAYYQMMMDEDVTEVGFVTDNLARYGCSPDGMVGDDGLLEIKNLTAKEHVKALAYYQKHRKAPTTYIAQVQMQLMVCERKWCDLLLHHEDLVSVIIRVHADKHFHSLLKQQISVTILKRDEYYKTLEDLS